MTNEIYKELSGMTAKEYKQFKGLRKEKLRDNMDSIEVCNILPCNVECNKNKLKKGLKYG